MDQVRIENVLAAESGLRAAAVRFLLSNVWRKKVRETRHFQEWFYLPMNYARIMEEPIAYEMISPRAGDHILDVSSPKLLAMLLSQLADVKITAADISEYFVKDFEIFNAELGFQIEISIFDAARRIPFDNDSFDKVFSVSVVEHMRGDGDHEAMKEMLRVLKPSGTLVVTVPVWREYMEEWSTDNPWNQPASPSGRYFFQKRYGRGAFEKLIDVPGSAPISFVLIAERPVAEPKIGMNGILRHNSYRVDDDRVARLTSKIGRRLRVPLSRYWAERRLSRRCHYLTTDWLDPNIRQAAMKLKKVR